LPFVRGILLLWEMLILGTRLMTLSANVASGAEEPPSPPSHTSSEPQSSLESASAGVVPATPSQQESQPKIGGASFIITVLISLTFAIAIFFVGPLLLTSLLHQQIGDGWLNFALEGLIRLGLLIGYLYLIGRI